MTQNVSMIMRLTKKEFEKIDLSNDTSKEKIEKIVLHLLTSIFLGQGYHEKISDIPKDNQVQVRILSSYVSLGGIS